MALNLTTAAGVLKDDYQPAVREQLNGHLALLAQVEKNTKDTQGTAAVIAIHVSRNSGVGARAEGGTLPSAGNQTHKQERISLKYNYGRIQISGQTIRHMASDKGAFIRAVESETKGVVTDLKRDVNRQCYTPASGVIGTTGTSPSSTTFTTTVGTARRLEIGGIYDLVVTGGDGIVYTITVTDIVVSTGVVTYTAVAGASVGSAATTNRIVLSGIVPSALSEITGLESIVASSGTLFNVDPTSFPVWRSYQRAVTAAPSDSLFEEALDEIQQAGGEDPNLVVVSYAAARAYANSLKSQKRFSAEPLELKGGFKATTVTTGRTSVGLMAERDCDTDVAYLVNTANLVEFEASDWEFMDEDGAVLSRVANKDAYEATLYKYHELATDKRNAHGKITGLVTS